MKKIQKVGEFLTNVKREDGMDLIVCKKENTEIVRLLLDVKND